MDNHIHLLIREGDEPIGRLIKRISSSYVYWYNAKYVRCGHLFQERFKSEIVELKRSFLTVLRYIHQNPVKAGLATNVFEAGWTSINVYFGGTGLSKSSLSYCSSDLVRFHLPKLTYETTKRSYFCLC